MSLTSWLPACVIEVVLWSPHYLTVAQTNWPTDTAIKLATFFHTVVEMQPSSFLQSYDTYLASLENVIVCIACMVWPEINGDQIM